MNCALGVVINVALVLGRMLNLQLTRTGEGVVDQGDSSFSMRLCR
jgi:hypothetical protein